MTNKITWHDVVKELGDRFTSGNSILIERATIKRHEWEVVLQKLYELLPDGLSIEHRLGSVLFNYIDRMNDLTDEDPAGKVLAEFLAEADPMLNAYFEAKSRASMLLFEGTVGLDLIEGHISDLETARGARLAFASAQYKRALLLYDKLSADQQELIRPRLERIRVRLEKLVHRE